MSENKEQKGFWLSMPGILMGIAAVIGAIGTTYVTIQNSSEPTKPPQLTTPAEHTPPEVVPQEHSNTHTENNTTPTPQEEPAAVYTVSGTWEYTADSQVSGAHCVNRLRLTLEGIFIVGIFDTCDGSGSGVEGTFRGNVLEFSRNTGLSTVQKFELSKVNDDKFIGTYWNVGEHQDAGTIMIQR